MIRNSRIITIYLRNRGDSCSVISQFCKRKLSSSTHSELKTITPTFSHTPLFHKILIANRGEIACRVIRTAKKLGIRTVAVFSDVDQHSDHVKIADEAVYIGPSQASQSYLKGEKIIEACIKTGAQAVHPGYGFLSENLQFCQQCEEAKIVFIGPPPNAIRAMGSKSESKDIMIKAGVPVTPGYHGSDQSNDKLLSEANRIGYPLMIKAVSGGGGKGMRAVFDQSKFLESLESCRREAKRSFNDDTVLLEKLIQAPRHVEVQIFGDSNGKAVHLLERDCSVQRRHQKVLEEAPAPNLDPKTRAAMHKAAVACAEAVGYRGAGTVEFLIDSKTQEFYFCEMNTRLQVEHPVTEMITGNDLVEWQLLVAAGKPLPLNQDQIIANSRGCAIEARIYAENPIKDFLPATGLITHLQNPATNSVEVGVRVDTGVSVGDTISTFYDPMIAKLITYGNSREEALNKLERALRGYQVAGLANNIDFLISIIHQKDFIDAKATTAFFEHNMKAILDSLQHSNLKDLLPFAKFASIAILLTKERGNELFRGIWSSSHREMSSWRQFSHVSHQMELFSHYGEQIIIDATIDKQSNIILNLHEKGKHNKNDAIESRIKLVSFIEQRNVSDAVSWQLSLVIDEVLTIGVVSIYNNRASKADVIDVWIDGRVDTNKTHYQLTYPHTDFSENSGSSDNPVVISPMPGKVVKVMVTDGASVKKGDAIVVLEAMKMEHTVVAPSAGIVTIFVNEGANVSDGTKLAEVNCLV